MMVAGRRIAFRGMFLMLAACSSTRIHGTPPDAYEDHPPDASVDGADEDTPREDMACPSLCSRYDPVHATTIQSPFVSLQILEDRILLIDLDCRPADRNCTTRLEVLDYSGTIVSSLHILDESAISAVWTGTHFGIFSARSADALAPATFHLVDPSGGIVTSRDISHNYYDVMWAGDSFAALTATDPDSLMFITRISTDGIDEPRMLVDERRYVGLAWVEDHFLMASLSDAGTITTVPIDWSGSRLAPALSHEDSGSADFAAVAPCSGGVVLTWETHTPTTYSVNARLHDADGNPLTPPMAVATDVPWAVTDYRGNPISAQARAACDGDRISLSYLLRPDDELPDILVTSLCPDGTATPFSFTYLLEPLFGVSDTSLGTAFDHVVVKDGTTCGMDGPACSRVYVLQCR